MAWSVSSRFGNRSIAQDGRGHGRRRSVWRDARRWNALVSNAKTHARHNGNGDRASGRGGVALCGRGEGNDGNDAAVWAANKNTLGIAATPTVKSRCVFFQPPIEGGKSRHRAPTLRIHGIDESPGLLCRAAMSPRQIADSTLSRLRQSGQVRHSFRGQKGIPLKTAHPGNHPKTGWLFRTPTPRFVLAH